MKSIFKSTKIIATSGPSITKSLSVIADLEKSENNSVYEEVIEIFEDLFLNGVNCIRFNFSHSNSDARYLRIKLINDVKKYMLNNASNYLNETKKSDIQFILPIVNMCDTKGPEIRVYKIGNPEGQTYYIGKTVEIHCVEKVIGDEKKFSVFDSTEKYNMAADCVPGNKILLDDGKLSLLIIESDSKSGVVKAKIENTHTLKTNKRINLPGASYSMPFLSENDIKDIEFSVTNDFPIIALSFVNKKDDVESVRKLCLKTIHGLNKSKGMPLLFSKIETFQSLKNLDEIIEASDGIMIARGDLGLEIPYYEVPYWTKQIIKKCAIKNIPVIVATQMLDSIERNIIPTRAEVTDVYRAAELGADSTMLSGETAQGDFPVLAVKTMKNIIVESEKRTNYEKFINHFKNHPIFSNDVSAQSFVLELYELVKDICSCNLVGVCAFGKDLDEDLIKAVTAAKLPCSLTIFESVESFDEIIGNESINNYALMRGINKVAVINQPVTVSECFKDFVVSYSYKFKSSLVGKKFVAFDGEKWVLNTL